MGALHLQRAPANFDTYLIVSHLETVGRGCYYCHFATCQLCPLALPYLTSNLNDFTRKMKCLHIIFTLKHCTSSVRANSVAMLAFLPHIGSLAWIPPPPPTHA